MTVYKPLKYGERSPSNTQKKGGVRTYKNTNSKEDFYKETEFLKTEPSMLEILEHCQEKTDEAINQILICFLRIVDLETD